MMKHNLIAAILLGGLTVASFATPALADPCASVKREMTYGRVAMQLAENKQEFLESAKEYENAVRKAPQCVAAHFNLGIVYEKAEQYQLAKEALRNYLRLSPHAKDADVVETKIFELEYLFKKANSLDYNSLSGIWCDAKHGALARDCLYRIEISGSTMKIFFDHPITGRSMLHFRGAFKGHEITAGLSIVPEDNCPDHLFPMEGIISPDAKKITLSYQEARSYWDTHAPGNKRCTSEGILTRKMILIRTVAQ